jgi:hypothetical protein
VCDVFECLFVSRGPLFVVPSIPMMLLSLSIFGCLGFFESLEVVCAAYAVDWLVFCFSE